MKRILAALVMLLMLAGCAPDDTAELLVYAPLENLPSDYSLEDAKKDRCVVMENGDITSGQTIWDGFVETTAAGSPASVRTATYYTLGDPSRYGEEYYESVKDEYPMMFVHDLTFDGEAYTLRWLEDGKEILRSYPYMIRLEGDAIPSATFKAYVRYVLVHDASLTWEKIEHGMYSSKMGDYIDHFTVYCDYIY